MDVECSEIAALKGVSRLLARHDAPVIVYECNALTLPKYGQSTHELVGHLERFGYTTYRVESKRYRAYRSDEFQPESWLDVIALKPRDARRIAARLSAPLTVAEACERIVKEAHMPYEARREYIARALEHADPKLLNHPSVRDALEHLAVDPSKLVRGAAQWWLHLRSPAARSA
jgi:hypothetical protein